MTHPAWFPWANGLQLVLAGAAVMLGAHQVVVWRGQGWRGPARLVAVPAVCMAGLLAVNGALLDSIPSSDVNGLEVVRAMLLSGLCLAVLPLADAQTDRPPPRWAQAAVAAAVAVRVGLWLSGHLAYTYTVVDGIPRYGPWEQPTCLTLVVLFFGYLAWVAASGRTEPQRVALCAGLLGSLGVAAAAVLASGLVGELLSGYLVVPMLAALVIVTWLAQHRQHGVVLEFAARQRALADLSRLAVVAPVEDLTAAVDVALTQHLRRRVGPAAPGRARADGAGGPGGGGRPWDGAGRPQDREFVAAVLNVLHAATDRDRAVAELAHLTSHDELTGLPNRTRVQAMVTDALAAAAADPGRRVTVAFCNLDRFKTVNDAYGHAAGDQFLRAVAVRLRGALWPCDAVGRFGSDEFVVVCAGGGGDSAEALADRIHRCLERPLVTDTTEARLGVTVGLAMSAPGQCPTEADGLLGAAVTAMHDAKVRRASTSTFRHELHTAALWRADVERRLSRACQRGHIVVHYQPIVDLGRGEIVAFEALARWRDGSRLVPPAEWIPVAEATGLIHEIGEHVLLAAAQQTAHWHGTGHTVGVSVNVSARQLCGRRLADAVSAALVHVPRQLLCLELTESFALEEGGREVIEALSGTGIRLALDDFGTGYSSLAVVAQLPIQQVKIDRSITTRLDQPNGGALVDATLAIARSFGLTVVAEGVETPAQHHTLVGLACHRAQGYVYSRPLDADAATDLLRRGIAPVGPPEADGGPGVGVASG